MKKNLFCIIPLIMLVMACATAEKPAANLATTAADNSSGMHLDEAIKQAATRINERVTAGSKIAPLNFNSPHDKFSSYVLDELTANLVDSGKLTVVDRKELNLIADEFAFQFSGEVGDDTMQEMGRKLGAQSIISGSLIDLDGFYRIVIRVLNVQNASVEVQYRGNVASDRIMTALLTGGKTATVAAGKPAPAAAPSSASAAQVPSAPAPVVQIPVQQATPPVPAEPPVPTTYKIGDKGPAGGFIFYDKGSAVDGWQYLEAAPASTEWTNVQWQVNLTYSGGKGTGIGTGNQNTQAITAFMNEGGAAVRPVFLCANLNFGGYNDWFLPSKTELNLMYNNLQQRGLGGFKNDWYWSSSESGDSGAWTQHFSDGSQESRDYREAQKTKTHSVRAVRQF